MGRMMTSGMIRVTHLIILIDPSKIFITILLHNDGTHAKQHYALYLLTQLSNITQH